MLLFRTSRRVLLDRLRRWADEIPKNTNDENARRRRDNLERALKTAGQYFSGREFWTDAKYIAESDGGMQMQTVPERESEDSSSRGSDDSGQGPSTR